MTLKQMKENFEAKVPDDTLAVMHRTTAELAKSGIIEKTLQPGATAPAFTLLDEQEREVHSGVLLQNGPLVVSFYRGVW